MITKVAIHSVPRSGSSWLGNIFNSSPDVIFKFQPLFSYKLKGYLSESSTKNKIEQFFDILRSTEDDFIDQLQQRKSGKLPEFRKNKSYTHIIYKEVRYHNILSQMITQSDVKVIGLVRNPLAVVDSWLKAPKEFKKELGWKELDEWRFASKKNLNLKEEYNGYEKWKEATLLFQKLSTQFPGRFCLISYDKLLNSTVETIEQLFSFVNLKMTKETIEFINETKSSNNIDAYSVYRKKINDDKWKTRLNQVIVDEILKDLENSPLKEFL